MQVPLTYSKVNHDAVDMNLVSCHKLMSLTQCSVCHFDKLLLCLRGACMALPHMPLLFQAWEWLGATSMMCSHRGVLIQIGSSNVGALCAQEYARQHGFSTGDLGWLFATRSSTNEQRQTAVGAWTAIAERLPARRLKAVWAAGTRMLHAGNFLVGSRPVSTPARAHCGPAARACCAPVMAWWFPSRCSHLCEGRLGRRTRMLHACFSWWASPVRCDGLRAGTEHS